MTGGNDKLSELHFSPEAVALMAVGLALCFQGLPLYRGILWLVGLAVGAGTAFMAVALHGHVGTWEAVTAGLVGALMGFILIRKLLACWLFLTGLALGKLLTAYLAMRNFVPMDDRSLELGICLLAGVVAVAYPKIAVCVASSSIGAVAIVLAAVHIMGVAPLGTMFHDPRGVRLDWSLFEIAATVLSLTGMLAQWRSTSSRTGGDLLARRATVNEISIKGAHET